jgi:putative transposase
MAQSAITSLRQAEAIIKEMQVAQIDFGEGYRSATREALKQILEERMASSIDRRLDEIARRDGVDRRNGTFSRHLLTELGDIELSIPRTRTGSAVQVVRAYARRVDHVDRMILSCFVLGLSTRKVSQALLPVLGEPVSPMVVSRVAKTLDGAVRAFHARPLKNRYRFLLFDGVVLKRRTGGGAIKRVVLVAMGIRPDGNKEVIDFFLAQGESQQAWEAFLNDLYRRGLDGENVELIVTDGGKGLLRALGLVFPRIPHQRCWAHKTRNVVNSVKKADQKAIKRDLHRISHAKNRREAQAALKIFVECWQAQYPKAVVKVRDDIDSLLAFFQVRDPELWTQVRTTNAIERLFVEVRRRTRPMGVFADNTSIERIMFAIFTYENINQGTGTPFLAMTQNS